MGCAGGGSLKLKVAGLMPVPPVDSPAPTRAPVPADGAGAGPAAVSRPAILENINLTGARRPAHRVRVRGACARARTGARVHVPLHMPRALLAARPVVGPRSIERSKPVVGPCWADTFNTPGGMPVVGPLHWQALGPCSAHAHVPKHPPTSLPCPPTSPPTPHLQTTTHHPRPSPVSSNANLPPTRHDSGGGGEGGQLCGGGQARDGCVGAGGGGDGGGLAGLVRGHWDYRDCLPLVAQVVGLARGASCPLPPSLNPPTPPHTPAIAPASPGGDLP